MGKYISIEKTMFTEDYLKAISIILESAGYTIKENDAELKIYLPREYMKAWALKMFYECNLA